MQKLTLVRFKLDNGASILTAVVQQLGVHFVIWTRYFPVTLFCFNRLFLLLLLLNVSSQS